MDQLVKSGLITKLDRNYSLTTDGLALADRVSHSDMTVRKQPHIVTTISVVNDVGQTILFRHAFQPYLGRAGFPQGRMHYGEDIAQAAQRELFEKTGLQNVDLIHRGIAYIRTTKDGVDLSKIFAHVFSGQVVGAPELVTNDPRKGTSAWGDADALVQDQQMPGFARVRELLASQKELFFAEIEALM
ncbi:MAG TPA: NUDIX hydrolase [Candidatus Saccharimonadales bacterium]|nr:NUDIX hydrolase [Candidatus Saccharimonadales bacterium]